MAMHATTPDTATRQRGWMSLAAGPFLVGLATWAAVFIALPSPLAARILLLAPLVVVPRLLAAVPRDPLPNLAGWPSLLAALPLLVAFALPQGPIAAVFALPWLGLAVVGVATAVRHALSLRMELFDPRRIPDVGIDVALGFLGVGGGFTVIDRLGVDVGYTPVIVLLTATHFHFAGLALTVIACLMARQRAWLRLTIVGMVVGMPVTALGFIVESSAINAVGALVVGLSGIGVGIALLMARASAQRGWVQRAAGAMFLAAMPMGIAWSRAILTGTAFVDLDTMVRTHGILNASGVVLTVIAGAPPE